MVLKEEINREARRHSNKLIKKIKQVMDLPEIAEESIHREMVYASQDAYRMTMKLTNNRNGDMKHEAKEDIDGNK